MLTAHGRCCCWCCCCCCRRPSTGVWSWSQPPKKCCRSHASQTETFPSRLPPISDLDSDSEPDTDWVQQNNIPSTTKSEHEKVPIPTWYRKILMEILRPGSSQDRLEFDTPFTSLIGTNQIKNDPKESAKDLCSFMIAERLRNIYSGPNHQLDLIWSSNGLQSRNSLDLYSKFKKSPRHF